MAGRCRSRRPGDDRVSGRGGADRLSRVDGVGRRGARDQRLTRDRRLGLRRRSSRIGHPAWIDRRRCPRRRLRGRRARIGSEPPENRRRSLRARRRRRRGGLRGHGHHIRRSSHDRCGRPSGRGNDRGCARGDRMSLLNSGVDNRCDCRRHRADKRACRLCDRPRHLCRSSGDIRDDRLNRLGGRSQRGLHALAHERRHGACRPGGLARGWARNR